MSRILTPKGWRDLIVEEQTDLHEQRVGGFTRDVPDNEYISRSDAEKEGFEDITFTHYGMANNQKAHFDRDSSKVFDFLDDRGYPRSDLKAYMIISTKNYGGGKKGVQVLHHVQALSPVDAWNRGTHADMQRGTKATEFNLDKSIPSGVKVIPHKSGSSNIFREVKKLKLNPKK